MNLINIILISFILQFVSQTPVLRTYSIVMNLIWSSRREIHLKSTHCGNKGFGGNGWSLSSNKSASGSWFVCLEGERELPVVLPSMILNSRAMFTARCLCSVKKVKWEPPSMARLTKNLHSAGFSPPQHCLPLSAFPRSLLLVAFFSVLHVSATSRFTKKIFRKFQNILNCS